MQVKYHYEDDKRFLCNIPDEHVEVMPNVPWGSTSQPFTPAYWRLSCVASGAINDYERYRLGNSLLEETIACLLGGHAIKGEIGLAAFYHLKNSGCLDTSYSEEEIVQELLKPLDVDGRKIKYRFPNQKARYIKSAIDYLSLREAPTQNGQMLRNWLTNIPGIGYKTASWVARNWLDADDVAILDIHIHRAGVICGFFNPSECVNSSYLEMEKQFLNFSNAIDIPANILDNQIWNQMRSASSVVRSILEQRKVASTDSCGLPPVTNNRSTTRNQQIALSI